MEVKKTVRVLSILKTLHEACLFLCLLLLLQLVGLVWAWATKHPHCGCVFPSQPLKACIVMLCVLPVLNDTEVCGLYEPCSFLCGKRKNLQITETRFEFSFFHPSVRTMPSSTDLLGSVGAKHLAPALTPLTPTPGSDWRLTLPTDGQSAAVQEAGLRRET